jgi:hypothetical protein
MTPQKASERAFPMVPLTNTRPPPPKIILFDVVTLFMMYEGHRTVSHVHNCGPNIILYNA